MRSFDTEILEDLQSIPVIDTHEHLIYDDARELPDYPDALNAWLMQYIRSDLITAGITQAALEKATDLSRPLRERWKILEPYWESCRYTGYGRCLDLSVRGLYGIDGIRAETVEMLQQRYTEKCCPGHTSWVLKDKCGIAVSFVDLGGTVLEECNPLFKNVWQPEAFILPGEAQADMFRACRNLDEWCAAAEHELDRTLSANNCRVIKLAIAYKRSLLVKPVSQKRAEDLFLAEKEKLSFTGFAHELQDYMIHFLLRASAARGLTVQIHTGHFEGNAGDAHESDPTLFIPLVQEYPEVQFDLFHIGYPYYAGLLSMCKTFPNVFADMCWAHILSPPAARNFLYEFLQTVPYSKLSAFGGDFIFPDCVYGHLQICRENVGSVLSRLIYENVLTSEQAMSIAEALFYSNPRRILQWTG